MSSSEQYVIVKYDYNAQEDQELTIKKNERLKLLDDSKNWWKVCRIFLKKFLVHEVFAIFFAIRYFPLQ